MDWEKKFSTIVHETEANLDRVRRRLQAAKDHPEVDVPILHSTVLNIKRAPASAGEGLHHTPTRGGPHLTPTRVAPQMAENNLSSPPIWATVLEEKFNKQQTMIEKLLETIVALQTEKEQQKTAIEHLSDRISTLQERVQEKGVDLDTEDRIQQWKLETSHQINILKQQVQHQPKPDAAVGQPTNQVVEHLRTQIKDAMQACRDETESARKDVDYYKTRMMRLEKNISVLGEELGELTRRHNDLNSDVTTLTDRYRSDFRELSSGMREKQANLSITRNELSALKADVADAVPSQTRIKRRSPGLNPELRLDGNKVHSSEDRIVFQKPTQWRELLSHSLSTMSIESSDSTLSSGYLARRRSRDSNMVPPDELLAGDEHVMSSSDEEIDDILSTPSTSPSSLSINDL